MKRNDWVAIGVSVAMHAALLLVLSFVMIGASDPQPIGFIEVEFGPIADGRPVQRSQDNVQQDAPAAEQPPEEDPTDASAPDDARPTDVPDERIADEEVVSSSDSETISPRTETNPDDVDVERTTPAARQTRPTGTGVPDGSGGEPEGDEGSGTDQQRSAPFQIEGLNRVPVAAPLPAYSEQVNAVIRVRITVDPLGRVVQRIPLLKGNPALERSVLETLSTWRFNPLPPNAPRENQSGTITFRFRLE